MEENVLNKVDDLVDTIKSSEEYQRYLIVSKNMYSNTNIMDKIKKIKKLQKEINNLSSRGENITSKEQEINLLLEELNSYPIYVEYEERYRVDDDEDVDASSSAAIPITV